MAEITLRAYVKEIDDLIEREKLDEAIAHCRHILQTYPKHLDTYRMLGKAYLEAKRFGDAAPRAALPLRAVRLTVERDEHRPGGRRAQRHGHRSRAETLYGKLDEPTVRLERRQGGRLRCLTLCLTPSSGRFHAGACVCTTAARLAPRAGGQKR